MLKGKIEFEGKTYSDVETAIDEAKKKILQEIKTKSSGIASGFDRIGDGDYRFEIGDKKLMEQKNKMKGTKQRAQLIVTIEGNPDYFDDLKGMIKGSEVFGTKGSVKVVEVGGMKKE